jgi:hypothetical protein
LAIYEEQLKAESCSFCGRTVLEVTSMVGETPRICNICIRKFHEALHDEQRKI